MPIRNNLKALRDARQLSQHQLAAKIDTTNSTISKLEKGHLNLTAEWMERLATGLDVHPTELIDDRPKHSWNAEVIVPDAEIDSGDGIPWFRRRDGWLLYRVLTDALDAKGIAAGGYIVVDTAKRGTETLRDDCLVLVAIENDGVSVPILRQFAAPEVLHANSRGTARLALSLSNPVVRVVGVIVMRIDKCE